MKFFNSTRGLFYFVVIVIAISIIVILPIYVDVEFLATILGVATFLFGTFMAFSLSDRHTRIDSIRENDSVERSQLAFLYRQAIVFGKEFQKKLQHEIDEYLMVTLDYTIWDYNKSEKQFAGIEKVIRKASIKSKVQEVIFSNFIGTLNEIEISRRKTIGLIDDRISKFEWIVFVSFSLIIVASLSLLNSGSGVSLIITFLISLSVFILLYFLYSLDILSWKEETRIFEPYAKCFESVGLLRYYPESLIADKRVKNYIGKDYRMGTFPNPYPDLSGKKIVVVMN